MPRYEAEYIDAIRHAYHHNHSAPFLGQAHISFNGKFRDECLNEHWFISLTHARSVIEAWRIEYNTERRHRSLGNRMLEEFAADQLKEQAERRMLTADSNALPD